MSAQVGALQTTLRPYPLEARRTKCNLPVTATVVCLDGAGTSVLVRGQRRSFDDPCSPIDFRDHSGSFGCRALANVVRDPREEPSLSKHLASTVLLLFLLTGCLPNIGTKWVLHVVNTSTSGTREGVLAVCGGRLTASVTVPGRLRLSAVATHGDDYSGFVEVVHDRAVRIGDPVIIEASCHDTGGAEVGYARVEGHIIPPPYPRYLYGGHTFVSPAARPGAERNETCLSPTEARGAAPCISEPMVAPS